MTSSNLESRRLATTPFSKNPGNKRKPAQYKRFINIHDFFRHFDVLGLGFLLVRSFLEIDL